VAFTAMVCYECAMKSGPDDDDSLLDPLDRPTMAKKSPRPAPNGNSKREREKAAKKAAREAKAKEEEDSRRFVQDLQSFKDRQYDFTVRDVKAEFEDKYEDRAKSLLCSGCKITALRIGDELSSRNASEQPNPGSLLNITKQAMQTACEIFFPTPMVISAGKKGPEFTAYEKSQQGGKALAGVELRRSQVAERSVQRLCWVILDEFKIAMLQAMIQHKVPHERERNPGQAPHDNWERWLCAKRARLCKRHQVMDDDEEEEGEL